MKTIGLIGGMSWESSLEYYKLINQNVKNKLGGLHSAKCLMYSFDFQEIEILQHQGKWDELAAKMIGAAEKLQTGGADFFVICTNTMHKVANAIERKVQIPLLHIADTTGDKIVKEKLTKVGLLGTKFTMEEAFYKQRLEDNYGINVVIPSAEDREVVHNIIYSELCLGEIRPNSREKLKDIINRLVSNNAKGIILGCTEIPLLIKQADIELPIFDTTTIHANAAVDYALK